MQYTDQGLSVVGIESSLFALEIEFIPAELPVLTNKQKKSIEDLKKRVLAHAAGNPEKLAYVEKFTPEQLMMYELHELDEKTSNILEYLFGTGREDNSYYDAVIGTMKCMEVKLKPVASHILISNLKIILQTLEERTNKYGLKITDPKIQLNMSFYKNGKNIFDPFNKDFKNEGALAISGILKSIYENSSDYDFLYITATGATPLISLGPGREGFARLTGEGNNARLELRPSRCGASIKDINLEPFIEKCIKPGVIAGIKNGKHELKKIMRALFSRRGEKFKVTLHVLQGSEVKKAIIPKVFKLIPPEKYITGWLYLNFAKIALELGYEPISPTVDYEKIKFLDPKKYDDLMNEYIKTEGKRLEYLRALSEKNNRNKLEEIEYNFLRNNEKNGVMNWPGRNEFHDHFRKQAMVSITLPQILQFFSDIKIIRKSGSYKIIWPRNTELFGAEFPMMIDGLDECIICSGLVDSLRMEPKELQATRINKLSSNQFLH